MRCDEARKFLSAFLDGELDVRTNVELLEHIEMCEDCLWHLERLRGLQGAVKSYITSLEAPERLQARFLEALRVPGGLRSRLDVPLHRLARSGWFRVSAAAASILLVFGLVYRFLAAPPAALNKQAILAHMAVMQDEVPTFYFTGDPERARRLALFRMDDKPEVPLLDREQFELVGAGPAEMELKNVGHFVFRHKAITISMFVFEGLDLEEVEGRPIETHLGPGKVESRGGFSLLAWRREGFTYVLVGRLPASQLAERVGLETPDR